MRTLLIVSICVLLGASAHAQKQALLVHGATPTSSDLQVSNHLTRLGFTVTGVTGPNSATTQAEGKDLILVSSTVSSGDVNVKYRDVAVPVINWEQALQDEFDFVAATGASGEAGGQTSITIVNSTSPLAAGLPLGDVTVFTSAQTVTYGINPAPSAAVIAHFAGDPTRICYYGIETGAPLFSGTMNAPARRLHFFHQNDGFVNLTPTGLRLFNAAIVWAANLQLGPVGISQEPSDVTVLEGNTATFTVGVTSTPPVFSVQWRSNGVEIVGANGLSYTTPPLLPSAEGTVYSALIFNDINSVTTRDAVLHVTTDTVKPQMVFAMGAGDPVSMLDLVFSEPVDPSSGADVSNYTLSSVTYLLNATLDADGRTVHFTIDPISPEPLTNGTMISVVGAVNDRASVPNTLEPGDPGSSVAIITTGGAIRRHVFTGLSTTAVALSDLTNSAKFPNAPDVVDFPTLFETPVNAMDGYGVQFLGYVTPPVSGNYHFFLSADDNAVLYLSTDDQPGNKVQIAYEPVWNDSRQWLVFDRRNASAPENRSSTLFPSGIPLVAGQRYYIETLMKEGGGGDNLAVAWQKPGDPLPPNGSTPIPGFYLTPYNEPVTLPAGEPADVTIQAFRPATFRVRASGSPFLFYQWYENDAPIANATSNTLVLPGMTLADDSRRFYVVVTNSFSMATSRVATLTVLPDTIRPVVLSVSTVNSTNVSVRFNEQVTSASATDTANYTVNGGSNTIVSITLRPDGEGVVIALDPTTPLTAEAFSVTVQSVADLAGNVMENPATLQGIQWMAGIADIGGPLPAGEVFSPEPGVLEVTAGGADVWGTSDQFTFVYEFRTNYFDVNARIDNLPYVGNSWSKAGLNIRESLEPTSRMVWTYPTPLTGANQYEAGVRAGTDIADFGRQPRPNVNTLPAYVRVKRVGSTFTAYSSSNGVDWVVNGITDQPVFAPTLLVGLGTVSHIQGTPVTATYGHYGDTLLYSNAVITITAQPASQTAEEGHNATFTVSASASGVPAQELGYQWQAEATPGAGDYVDLLVPSRNTYTTPLVTAADNGRRYRVVLLLPGASLMSQPALLTVTPDTTPPKIVSASADCGDSSRISVVFNEIMSAGSISDTISYTVTHGATVLQVTNVVANADNRSAEIFVDGSLSDSTNYYIISATVTDAQGVSAETGAKAAVVLPSARAASGADNIVSVEAENYDQQVVQGNHSWEPFTGIAGYSGATALDSVPNSGAGVNEPSHITGSPRLDYCIQFPTAGTYYVWIRGYGRSGSDDSLHVGLDGASPDSFNWRVTGFNTSGFTWQRNSSATPARVNVPTAGRHVFNVWMREDGTIIDKIVLTSNSGYTPSGTGPAESGLITSMPPDPRLTTTYTGGNLSVNWGGIGTLLEADQISGPWTPVSNPANPFVVPVTPTVSQKFYRVTVP